MHLLLSSKMMHLVTVPSEKGLILIARWALSRNLIKGNISLIEYDRAIYLASIVLKAILVWSFKI